MSRRKRAALLVLVLCLAAAALLCFLAAEELTERRAGSDYYADLLAQALPTAVHLAEEPTEAPSGTAKTLPPQKSEAPTIVPANTAVPASAATETKAPMGTVLPTEAARKPGGSPARSMAAIPVPKAAATARPVPTAVPVQAAAAPTIAVTPALSPAPTAPASASPVPTQPASASQMDFDALRQAMPDVCGWLTIPDTRINYPIVHGADNAFYLAHLPDGTPNSAGSIMLDMDNAPDWSDTVSILHGHHMRSGEMFGGLEKYGSASYAAAHERMTLYTPAGDWCVEVIAACTVDGSTLGWPVSFADEAAMQAFVERLVRRSAFKTEETVQWGDRLLLLSTCDYDFANARFVVLGKMCPIE